jgi:hypothetical protein
MLSTSPTRLIGIHSARSLKQQYHIPMNLHLIDIHLDNSYVVDNGHINSLKTNLFNLDHSIEPQSKIIFCRITQV